ncbi:Intraflagellar transport protein 57 [Terramyces sp. JEL0728]|nr:Intraflagellar transport protein 57 [Terramyces sp. JEL0728]
MSLKGNDMGSMEQLSSGGRSSSRGTLASTAASLDEILDKLKCLNYQKEFCIPNNIPPIHRFYFVYPDANPNEQFYTFALLFTWFMKIINIPFEKPGQFDDPNATCANIAAELKKLGIPFEYGPQKLRQAYGDACLYVLQSLADIALSQRKIAFQQPIHKVDDYPEEAEVDYDAEVTTETVEEVEANQEEDENFMDTQIARKQEAQPQQLPKTDPAEWRLEVERVTPLLKVVIPNDNKDWRLHLQQMDHHQKNIQETKVETHAQLTKLHSEIEQSLEKIASREKYINSQFETQVYQANDQASDSKHKYTVASSNVTELTNELARISEDLDSVKSRMDELGSGMTDSKPLVTIKQGSAKLKVEHS